MLAINSNDEIQYPEDGFEKMVARSQMKNFNFPYLRDATQEVARAYGATHTPQLFVFNQERCLAYTGKFDDNWQNPSAVTKHHLQEAVETILNQGEVAEPATHAIGCTIKWAES